jgi:hypothetical protein
MPLRFRKQMDRKHAVKYVAVWFEFPTAVKLLRRGVWYEITGCASENAGI